MSSANIEDLPGSIESDVINLDIVNHEISFIVPVGAQIAGEVLLPGGALICGKFSGKIKSSRGSIIIANGAVFEGEAEADSVYIAGSVRNYKIDGSRSVVSKILGHVLIAVSLTAEGQADLRGGSFSVNSGKFSARFIPITGDLKKK